MSHFPIEDSRKKLGFNNNMRFREIFVSYFLLVVEKAEQDKQREKKAYLFWIFPSFLLLVLHI